MYDLLQILQDLNYCNSPDSVRQVFFTPTGENPLLE